MKRLATIAEKSTIPGKRSTITEYFFVIQGEEEGFKASEVVFRPLTVLNKLIKRDPVDATKVINETVFFDGVKKGVPIPDKLGGNACGRTFPVWEGVKEFSAAERKHQKEQAGYYTYLFGEVTFPGKKPELVNFRITPGQLGAWMDVQKNFPRSKEDWGKETIKIEVFGDKYAELAMSFISNTASTEDDNSLKANIIEFVEEHNEGITNGR